MAIDQRVRLLDMARQHAQYVKIEATVYEGVGDEREMSQSGSKSSPTSGGSAALFYENVQLMVVDRGAYGELTAATFGSSGWEYQYTRYQFTGRLALEPFHASISGAEPVTELEVVVEHGPGVEPDATTNLPDFN